MSASALQAALARVREQHNTATTSDSKEPTPLATYIYLYNKAGHECYIDYMTGAKKLYEYLSPIEIPDVHSSHLTNCSESLGILHSYEVQQVALVLAGKEGYNNPQFKYIQSLVVYYTAKQILGMC